jgi:putative transcriptional regulator
MRAIRAALSALAALAAIAWVAPAAPAADDSDSSSVRPGEFLIAAPGMNDPRFYHAVILIVQHDRGGAFGLVVNRPVADEPLAKLLRELGQKTDGASGQIAIYAGGPVESAVGFVLHSAEYKQPETMAIDKELAVTSSPAVLRDIATQRGPQKYIFAFGYAGWGAGQLENELAHRVWFSAPGDAKLLFDDDPAKLWQDALERRERAL